MGRPEAPLDGRDGPVADFAARLRRLRDESGGRSYRQLAKAANFAAPTLARAASGRSLPSWDVTSAYVAACGGDLREWRSAWAVTARLAAAGMPGARVPGSDMPGAGRPGGALPGGGAGGPGAPLAGIPARQLPAGVADFTGRAAESGILRRLADAPASDGGASAPQLAVISGPGGIGKSTLAVHAARLLAPGFPDGQLFADLHGHDDHPAAPVVIAAGFLAALGCPAYRGADPVAAFRSVASDRRLIILLDNAADEAQVTPLLPGSARCLVLVTSRQVLGALAGAVSLRLGVLGLSESVELLTKVAGPDQIGGPELATSLAELCGRFPLALRIAGSRLASGPRERARWLVGRLRDEEYRLRHLVTGSLDLSAVFGLSYRSLPDLPRRAFLGAGLFPGPDFAADAVALLAGLHPIEAGCALDRLADASLVQPTGAGRYRMHHLVRLYARERAAAEGAATRRAPELRRLADWYLRTADAADRAIMPARGRPAPMPASEPRAPDPPPMPDQATAQAWYDAEQPNLVAIARAAASNGDHDIAWRLPVAMRGLLELRGHTEDLITLHELGLDSACAIGDREAQGWVLNGLGTGYWRREAHADAIGCFTRALAIRTAIGDDRGVAVVLNNLGSVYGAAGRYPEAISCLRQALAIREKLGDELDKSFALNSLGHVQHELGQFAEALPLLQEALRIRRQLRNRNGEAATLHCLGDTMTGLGRPGESLACLRQALRIFRQLGNRYGEAATLHSLGSACRALGRNQHADRYLLLAISLYQILGRSNDEAGATRELAAGAAAHSAPGDAAAFR